MEKCFIHRLTGEIQDSALQYLSKSSFGMRYFDNAPQDLYGVDMEVSEPMMIFVQGSYFTDVTGTENYGTSILYNGSDFYIKKPSGENATVFVDNKFAIRKFVAKLGSFTYNGILFTAVDMIGKDSLSESLDITEINIGSSSIQGNTKLNTEETFAKLTKLQKLDIGATYYAVYQFVINELAQNQIDNGRDYNDAPILEVKALSSNTYAYYIDGNGEQKKWPSSTIVIVFKSDGYELHQDTEDGTLLYDSVQ